MHTFLHRGTYPPELGNNLYEGDPLSPENYRTRRTVLLFEVGGHQCLWCGHPGSKGNLLEFHHCNNGAGRHGIGGRQQLVRLEQDWWEWQKFHRPEHEMIVLCHRCHSWLHSKASEQEALEDEELFQELSRFRFCANQSNQCRYKRCLDCSDYRTNLVKANQDLGGSP